MKVIGFAGKAGSGKTTAAQFLVDHYGYTSFAFADCLKRACAELFLLDHLQLHGSLQQKMQPDHRWFGCSARQIMQYVGTDLLRNQLDVIMPGIAENLFTHHFEIWLSEYKDNGESADIVVSDVRFKNEIESIRKNGGIVIYLARHSAATSTHISENDIDKSDCDICIENNGDLQDFYNVIATL